ncbi:MAG: hypothetical protein QXF61_03030 [Nitrososphaeria archaeon]
MINFNDECPVCGGKPIRYRLDETNLKFLGSLGEQKINAAVSLARIVWHNIPELGHIKYLKVIEDISKGILQDLRLRVDDLLRSIKILTEMLPEMLEKMPADIRGDISMQFNEVQNRLIEEFRMLKESAPTFQNFVDIIQTIGDKIEVLAKKEIEEMKIELNKRLKEIFDQAGFPEPQQMKLLAQLIPSILPLLEELVRFQKIPTEKGKAGEVEITKNLRDYYPEDEFVSLGGPDDTDLLAKPRYNGTYLGYHILIESKSNNSGWDRIFITEVRKHMKLRNENLAILAVEVMPKGANEFLIEHHAEGVIIVTARESLTLTYGALRGALIALHKIERKDIDLRKVFTDKRVEEVLVDIFRYKEYIKNIRTKAEKISRNCHDITAISKELDEFLKCNLKKLQFVIEEIVKEYG